MGHAGIKLGDGLLYTPNMVDTESHVTAEIGDTFMHNGIHLNLAAGATLNHTLTTGSREVHLKMFRVTAPVGPMTLKLSEAPTVTVAGTLGLVVNKNRSSTTTATAVMREDATVTATGIHLEGDIIAGSKQEGGSQRGTEDEWILASNTVYLFQLINSTNTAEDINFHIEWYESTE